MFLKNAPPEPGRFFEYTNVYMIQQDNQEQYEHKVAYIEALADLELKEKQIKLRKGYGKAYFWSVFLPPIGIFYFFKYLFFSGGEKESIKAGVISLILTIVSLLVSFWSMAVLINQMMPGGSSSESMQMLQNLTTPENQKALLQLYK